MIAFKCGTNPHLLKEMSQMLVNTFSQCFYFAIVEIQATTNMIVFRSIHKINQSNFLFKCKSLFLLHKCDINPKYRDNFGSTRSQLIVHKYAPHVCLFDIVILGDQKRFYTNFDKKNLNYRFEKSKRLLTDNIEMKRLRIRERKEVLVKEIRDKKSRVQEKVRKMEEIVERENILTIPNLLCVARSFLSPYIGYVIIQGHYQLAIGLLVFAGLTDLVRSL